MLASLRITLKPGYVSACDDATQHILCLLEHMRPSVRQSALTLACCKHLTAPFARVSVQADDKHMSPSAHGRCIKCPQPPQVRVMPRCWLVLLRFWLRVDKVLVRLRETRYFCDTAAAPATLLREVKHSDGTFAELRAAGAPPDGVRLRVLDAVLMSWLCPQT